MGCEFYKWISKKSLQNQLLNKPIFLFFSGYCHSSSVSASLENLCMSIESDSPLFFIFRTTSRDKNVLLQKDTEACPFRNIEYAFSYSTRGGAKVQVEINYEAAFLLLCTYNFTRFLSVMWQYIQNQKSWFIFLLKHLKLSSFDLINSYLSFFPKNNSN